MQLVDRRVIVTGGARGIAEAVVRTLVKEGAKVASLDILDEEGEAVVREANAGGPGHASYFHCDVAKREETNRVIDAAVAALGGLDALVNIAGVERTSAAEDIADAEYDFIMDVNMRGTMYTNQAAFRHLKATGGQIVNFGSGAGVRGMPGGAHYSASKGAVLAWSRTVAQEWARYNITVNADTGGDCIDGDDPGAAGRARQGHGPGRADRRQAGRPDARPRAGHHLPRLRRRPLHHRSDAAGGRRDVIHDLTSRVSDTTESGPADS